MRKRKPSPPTPPQQQTLRDLVAAGAITAETACRAPIDAGANLLNRLHARGWLAKAPDNRCWVTAEGEAALAPHLADHRQAFESAGLA